MQNKGASALININQTYISDILVSYLRMDKKTEARIFDKPFSHKKLLFKSKFIHNSDVMVARYDHQDTIIAIGTADGFVRLYNINTLNLLLEVNTNPENEKYPVTALKWRPVNNQTDSGISSILAANASGKIIQFSTKTGKRIYENIEQDNYVFALDYSCNGKQFATTGKDCKIRIYDSQTKSLQSSLAGVAWHRTGHNNRLFGLKFSPDNPNLLISGGWDQNIHIWDTREGSVVGSIIGPKICGDSIDIKDKYIATGAHRINDQLQIWQLGTQKLVHSYSWQNPQSSGFLFGVQFSKTNNTSLAGIGGNALKIFDYKQSNFPELMEVRVGDTLYGMDMGNSNEKVLIGGKGGDVNCFNVTTV